MKRWVFVGLLFIAGMAYTQCLQRDVLIVADWSGSINGHESEFADAVEEFIESLPMSENGIRVGVSIFSDEYARVVNISGIKEHVWDSVQILREIGSLSLTEMTNAINKAGLQLYEDVYRMNVGKILVMISDGNPNNDLGSKEAATIIKSMGVKLYSVLVPSGSSYKGSEVFMKNISSTGEIIETDYKKLAKDLKSLDICL